MAGTQRKIVQMGASVGLTLPPLECQRLGIRLGSTVTVVRTKHGLMIRPAETMTLAERIAKSSVEAVRGAGRELVNSARVGREVL